MPNNLTAAQTKHVISQCRLLMATRTHATIAGFSTGIPTASLSCTRKALGINQDLFSHQRYVCDISQRDLLPRLTASLETLIVEETVARQALQEQRAVMASEARRGVDCLASVLGF
jgi:colanic acid/amylovoran biosynthesis protein